MGKRLGKRMLLFLMSSFINSYFKNKNSHVLHLFHKEEFSKKFTQKVTKQVLYGKSASSTYEVKLYIYK